MPVNRVAENVLGTLGTVCWTAQLIPQLWKSWRTKSTEGLSHWLVLIWSLSSIPLGIYVIVQNLNIPLILQPQLFGFFSLLSWGQCMYYNGGYSARHCYLMILGILVINASMQVGFVYAIRPAYHSGAQSGERGVQFFGVFSSIMIALALIPQYFEIHKHRAVIGISVTFMFVDLLGGVFSDLSLAFKPKFDVIASVTYSVVILMDGLVLIAAAILNPIARRRARAAAAAAGDPAAVPPPDDTTSITLAERGLGTGRAAALASGPVTIASADQVYQEEKNTARRAVQDVEKERSETVVQ